jgi:PPOX class probable F420-dependent enzyme
VPHDLSAEVREFLMHGTRTAKLGTLTPTGWPHVMPIWFALDGEELVFTTGRDTVKGRYLRRDDRVGLCVDDERPPFAYVHVRGRARIAVPTELLVRVRPERVIAEFDVAG